LFQGERLSETSVRQHCETWPPQAKMPKQIFIVAELPKSGLPKSGLPKSERDRVMRDKLREDWSERVNRSS
jgi:hypothetical protein